MRDWSIIKTAPLDILARPVPGHLNPRLWQLGCWLRCDATYAQIEDSTYFSAIEVNTRGRVAMYGATMQESEYEDEFCMSPLVEEQPLPDRTGEDRGPFLLFPEINPHLSNPAFVEEIAMHLTGLNYYATYESDLYVHELLAGRPWPMEGAISRFLIREPREGGTCRVGG